MKRSTLKMLIFQVVMLFFGWVHAAELTFHPAYFDKAGSSKLNKQTKDALERIAEMLRLHPDVTLTIEAFAGEKESETTSAKDLSQKRLDAALGHLTKKLKVEATRVKGVAKGSEGLANPFSKSAGDNRKLEFGFVSSKKETTPQTGDVIEVLYWNTLYHSLYQIGADQGFFSKEGFNMQLIATNHSTINQVNAVCGIEPFLKEKVTVFTGAVCGGSPHYAAAKGVPLVVIGGMLVGGSMLIAKPDMAALLKADWKNFKGKTIGFPHGTVITSMIISDALKKNGVDAKKEVKWKEFNSHEEVVEAINRGEIDAGDTYVPLNIRAKKDYGIVEVYNTVQLFPFHPCCRVITTKDKLDKNRNQYVKFMRALIRSHEYFVKQPKKSMDIIQKYTGYTMQEVSSSLTNPNFQLNPDPLKNGFIKYGTMMSDTGFIDKKVDYNKYIDTSVYKDALDGLIKEEPANPYLTYMLKQFMLQNDESKSVVPKV